jgi:hypothetical protein
VTSETKVDFETHFLQLAKVGRHEETSNIIHHCASLALKGMGEPDFNSVAALELIDTLYTPGRRESSGEDDEAVWMSPSH